MPDIQEKIDADNLGFIIEDLPKTLDSMKVGAERIKQIVLSLRNFSRSDEADLKSVDIHEGLDRFLLLLGHRIKENSVRPSIEVVKLYGTLPLVECYLNRVNVLQIEDWEEEGSISNLCSYFYRYNA